MTNALEEPKTSGGGLAQERELLMLAPRPGKGTSFIPSFKAVRSTTERQGRVKGQRQPASLLPLLLCSSILTGSRRNQPKVGGNEHWGMHFAIGKHQLSRVPQVCRQRGTKSHVCKCGDGPVTVLARNEDILKRYSNPVSESQYQATGTTNGP